MFQEKSVVGESSELRGAGAFLFDSRIAVASPVPHSRLSVRMLGQSDLGFVARDSLLQSTIGFEAP
jgi:hypothetical protein